MISSEHRFHGLASLGYVYQKGQTVRGPHFSIKYALNNRRSNYQAAVVVSRKVNKSAVVRNRIRRRIYETIRLMEPDIGGPFDIIITVFSDEIANLNSAQLHDQIKKQLTAAGIFSHPS